MNYGYFYALQKRQMEHDDKCAVRPSHMTDRFKSWVLHLSGLSGQLVATKEDFSPPLLADAFSTVLTAANALKIPLWDRVKAVDEADPKAFQQPLAAFLAATVGDMAKAVEEIDHQSGYPTRAEMERCTILLSYRIDLEFNRNHASISKALESHLALIEEVTPARPLALREEEFLLSLTKG